MSFPLILSPFPLPLYLFAIFVWLRRASLGKVIFRLSFILCYYMRCSLTDRPLLDNISSSYFHENFVSSGREELVIRANCLARVKLCHFWFLCVFLKSLNLISTCCFHTKVASRWYWSTLGKVFFVEFACHYHRVYRMHADLVIVRSIGWEITQQTFNSLLVVTICDGWESENKD